MYYQEDNVSSPYEQEAKGPFTMDKDFEDPNNPFTQDNNFVPGGILKQYKKRLNLTPEDVMDRDYMS